MDSKHKPQGFHSFGHYYAMGEPELPYVDQLKGLLSEIREAASNNKNIKDEHTTILP